MGSALCQQKPAHGQRAPAARCDPEQKELPPAPSSPSTEHSLPFPFPSPPIPGLPQPHKALAVGSAGQAQQRNQTLADRTRWGRQGLASPPRCFLLSTCAICTCKPQPDPAPGRGILVGEAPPLFPSLSRAEQRASPCRCINQHSHLTASAVPDAAGAPPSHWLFAPSTPAAGLRKDQGATGHSRPPGEPPRGTKRDPLVRGARARGQGRGCPPRHQPHSTAGRPRGAEHGPRPCLAHGSPQRRPVPAPRDSAAPTAHTSSFCLF